MIFKFEQDKTKNDIEVLIKYPKMNSDVERITALLKSVDTKLKCRSKEGDTLINVSDIYYIESVDKKTFVYCEKEVYKTELRLYQISQSLKQFGFVQISKSCVLNINVLDTIKPLLNSRMEATLKNKEHIFINRNYLLDIKEALEKGNNP